MNVGTADTILSSCRGRYSTVRSRYSIAPEPRIIRFSSKGEPKAWKGGTMHDLSSQALQPVEQTSSSLRSAHNAVAAISKTVYIIHTL
jgi:hypothetical protein